MHVMRNVPAHIGYSGRRVVSVFIANAFAQDDPKRPVRSGCRSPNCALYRPIIFQERQGALRGHAIPRLQSAVSIQRIATQATHTPAGRGGPNLLVAVALSWMNSIYLRA
ncbi:hypothetical protein DK419_02590 [Methylobacterium terrae]|uniref:Uncharacterized protein n=1 Tax=Methylobacterium terrae TaxID=2202827 RepID=A0A2U8WGI5_9HYPH|nr:hypothetical protein DK419_02590 [Methylobacterium terrae]